VTVTISRWDKAPYCFLNGDLPSRAESALEDELSYYKKGYEYSEAYRSGDWDGKTTLLYESRNDTRYFPVGVLDKAREVFDALNVDYELESVVRPGRGDMEYEWNADGIELRDYQWDAVTECLHRGSGTVVLPTGSGKTLIGLRVVYELNRPCVVISHRTEIVQQWLDRAETRLGIEPAQCFGGVREHGDFQVCLYQSLYEDGEVRSDVQLDHDIVILDETHRVPAKTWYRCAMAANASYRYGLTATYSREDGAELKIEGGVGPVISDLSPERLIGRGFLADPDFRVVDAPRVGRTRLWQAEVSSVVESEERNRLIVEEVQQLLAEGKESILVDVGRIAHGERVAALLEAAGVDARFVYSETSDRETAIAAFKNGEYPVLASTLLSEGWDAPGLEAIVLAHPTKSRTANIQKIGRCLRPQSEATIVDFTGSGEYTSRWFEQRQRDFKEYYGKYYP